MKLYYQEHQPTEALKPFVYCYWTMHTDGQFGEQSPLQRCFPSGCVELIIQSRGQRMQGLRDDASWFEYPRAIFTGINDRAAAWVAYGQSEIMGVRLTPEGALRLFSPPLRTYHNSFLNVDEFLNTQSLEIIDQVVDANTAQERLRLIDTFLLHKIRHKALEINYFTEALRIIRYHETLNISDLGKMVYVCNRQLQRTFRNTLGITPKGYHKVIRLYKAHQLGLLRAENFTEIAGCLGYADPAHFTRDFKNYFGVSPEAHFNTSGMYWMN